MLNPYFLIAALLAFMGAGFCGFKLGVDHQKTNEIDKVQLVAEAVDAANNASAAAIANIKVKNITLTNEVQHEVRTNTIYADCKLPDNGLRLVNAALDPSAAYSIGSGKLSQANPAK
jgi:preprotein translocase subunit SecF